jgi:predicted CoA-binding protein
MNHDTYPEDYVLSILQDVKTIALVGASANVVRPSYLVMKYMMEKGYTVIPVNPGLAGQELLGQMVFASLKDIPVSIDMVDIFRNADAALEITREALALQTVPGVIWMQLGVRNDEAAVLAEAAGLRVIMNRCPKMEYGKLSGEWAWVGGNSGILSSKRQTLHASGRVQSLGLREKT